MISWTMLALLGGLVGLDATSFPQAMISRPLISGTLAGALFGRPVEGLVIGFIMESFSLITLPIGAARYPEGGTAAVAAVGAYIAAVEPGPVTTGMESGLAVGALVIAVVFGFFWEWVAGESVVLLRRSNGQLLTRRGTLSGDELQRVHITAMTLDFARGAIVASAGAMIGYGLLQLLRGGWGLPDALTMGVLTLLVATMVGTTLPLFGGARARRVSWILGLAAGLAVVALS